MLVLAGLFYISKWYGVANFLVFAVLLMLFFHFIIKKLLLNTIKFVLLIYILIDEADLLRGLDS